MKKQELRKKYKELRKQFSFTDLDILTQRIMSNLCDHFSLQDKKISIFVPLVRFNEINTWHIIDSVQADFSLPVIGSNDELKHIRYEGKHQLKQNSFGILEPQSGEEVDPAWFEIVIVPLLTIDKNGYRVGYGKGYYDKFLAKCRPGCLFIGLYQFETIEEIDDLYDSDIAIHYCVTPSRIIEFGG